MYDLFGRDIGDKYSRHPDAPDVTVDWPDGTAASFGRKGLVLGKRGSYTTMFLEVYPCQGVFIRGEGRTAEECENACWQKWQKHLHCDGTGKPHQWEPGRYRNGVGTCTRCGVTESNKITHAELNAYCHICGTPTFDRHNDAGRYACREHCLSGNGEHVWGEDSHYCTACSAMHPDHPLMRDYADDNGIADEISDVLSSLAGDD